MDIVSPGVEFDNSKHGSVLGGNSGHHSPGKWPPFSKQKEGSPVARRKYLPLQETDM